MDLPVDAVLPELKDVLRRRTAAVLVAPPGAGKTTRAPLALLEEAWARDARILLLSPRRVAARAAAARMAHTLGESVGATVGYRVRLENRTSARTRIEVVTEGVFTRMILADPSLSGIAAVLFDEFHERSLDGDLGLALALDAQTGLREDLRLVVMSATLDGARVARLLDDAPVVVSEGRLHPVTERYLGRRREAPLEQDMADAILSALAAERGSVLCFLPGAREIERTRERLEGRVGAAVEIHTLYGALDARAQDAAIAPAPAGARKVVLATSIAETSLTIEGVRVVIDSGLSRRPRYEPGAGLTRLETVRESRASAEQRKGRAGRIEPGACWRLWDEPETRALAPFDRPEIMDAELAGLALDLASWGVRDPGALRWLDPPPEAAWREALETLRALGAIDADGGVTDAGRAIAALPVHPRLAHMIVRAGETGEARTAAMLALLLSEQGLGGRDADLSRRLEGVARDRSPRATAARRLADSIASRAGGARQDRDPDPDRAGALLLQAFPDRVAKARGKRGEFLMASGRAAAVDETDPLARAPFLVVAEISGRAGAAVILAAAPVAFADVAAALGDRIMTTESAVFDVASKGVRARRVVRLGAITLEDTPREAPAGADLGDILVEGVRAHGLSVIDWGEDATQARARIAFLRGLHGDEWPDMSDAALLENAGAWLAPLLAGRRDLNGVQDGALAQALIGLLPYPLQQRLAKEAPARFVSPAGGEHRIDYTAEGGPALDIRLQELFGVTVHPAVANGRAPLLLRLLSPAYRPVQTTRDLPGFWSGSYAGVRADMKGRYPKHPWPEDPASAEPTRRAKPKGT